MSALKGLTPEQRAHVTARWVVGRAALRLRGQGARVLVADLEAGVLDAAAWPPPDGIDVKEHVLDVAERALARVQATFPGDWARHGPLLLTVVEEVEAWAQEGTDLLQAVWEDVLLVARAWYPTSAAAPVVTVGWSSKRSGRDATLTTAVVGGEPVVTVELNRNVTVGTLMSMPYALGHELLVHAFSAHPVVDESDPFAEGWADAAAVATVLGFLQGSGCAEFRAVELAATDEVTARYRGRFDKGPMDPDTIVARAVGRRVADEPRRGLDRAAARPLSGAEWQELTYACNAAPLDRSLKVAACMNVFEQSNPATRSVAAGAALADALSDWLDHRDPIGLITRLGRLPE